MSTAADVVGLAIVVALAATRIPAIRAARSSTVDALNDVARPPRRRGRLIRLSNRLPVPALFGLRLVARRPRRALLSTANIAVTVTGIVAVLAFHAYADGRLSGSSVVTVTGLSDPVINRDEQMLTVITVILVTLAVLNALFTTWATVLDARHSSALMRALGARARQVTSGLVVAQVLSVPSLASRSGSASLRLPFTAGPAARAMTGRYGNRNAHSDGGPHGRSGSARHASAGGRGPGVRCGLNGGAHSGLECGYWFDSSTWRRCRTSARFEYECLAGLS